VYSNKYWFDQDALAAGQENVDPCALTAESYMYLGWALSGKPGEDYLKSGVDPNDSGISTTTMYSYLDGGFLGAIATALIDQAAAGTDSNAYNDDIPFTNDDGLEKTIYRLREGIERFFITDINNPAGSAKAQSTIPVMFDMSSSTAGEFNHIPGGGNVLFMDGHVNFIRFPGDFPVTRAFVGLVSLF